MLVRLTEVTLIYLAVAETGAVVLPFVSRLISVHILTPFVLDSPVIVALRKSSILKQLKLALPITPVSLFFIAVD